MLNHHVTIDELLRRLPEVEELEGVRLALTGVAVPDPGSEWAGSRRYSTVDKRVVERARLEEAVVDAERSLHEYVTALFASVRAVLDSCYTDDRAAASQQLVSLGERQEERGGLGRARQFYAGALEMAGPLQDRGPQILAFRRLGRVLLAQGELAEALLCYRRSAEIAADVGDLKSEVIARTGTGNVLVRQGRVADAEGYYRAALARVDEADRGGELRLERAQVYNNLAVTASRQGRFDEAERRLDEAERIWNVISSPVDRAVFEHVRGTMRVRQGDLVEGRACFERALTQPVPPSIRAAIATDLADLCLREGHVDLAVEWAREAEDHAIAARAPDYLASVYRTLGNIARDTEDDGVSFYEKALEIARAKNLLLSEGDTLLEYARLRARIGGTEEARAYLEHAIALFREIGATYEERQASRALGTLDGDLVAPPEPVPA